MRARKADICFISSSALASILFGADSGFGAGATHVQALLEHLAVIEATGNASLRAMLDLMQRDGQGSLVIVVGQTAGDELDITTRLRHRYGRVTVVAVGPANRGAARGATGGAGAPAGSLVRVTREMPFRTAWNQAMKAATARRGVATLPHGADR